MKKKKKKDWHLENQTNYSGPCLEKRLRLKTLLLKHIISSAEIETESTFRRKIHQRLSHAFNTPIDPDNTR